MEASALGTSSTQVWWCASQIRWSLGRSRSTRRTKETVPRWKCCAAWNGSVRLPITRCHSWRGLLLGPVPAGRGVVGQRGDEGLLGHLDPADHLHPLLADLLLLEQLALTGDVTAVALGQDVLAHRADGLPGDDPRTDGGLDRHLEVLARDQLAQL